MSKLISVCLLAAVFALPLAAQTMVPYETGRGWGYKDADGNIIVKAEYQAVSRPADGLGLVCIKNKWGAVNSKGETVIPSFTTTSISAMTDSLPSTKVLYWIMKVFHT